MMTLQFLQLPFRLSRNTLRDQIDFTVPIGIPKSVAIFLYAIPFSL